MICSNCSQLVPIAKMATRLRKVNSELYQLGLEFHDTLSYSLNTIDRILTKHGFATPSAEPIFSGLEGRLHQEVGEGKWLTVSWHRFDTGRYEVTAYVN